MNNVIANITDYLKGQRPFLDMFGKLAENVTNSYVSELYTQIEETGITPSFEELMDRVRALHDDLTRRAVWIREDYKEDRGRRSPRFTKGCKKIIDKSTNDFLTTVKLVLNRRNNSYASISA
ncbi:hypothetical protein CAP35_10985 [Chitinophagaceae bacterium IBVUCB1]|nr:hypothetical protein CAP35_10985 [Chitinophagaceae bacterium IBVUCB1]